MADLSRPANVADATAYVSARVAGVIAAGSLALAGCVPLTIAAGVGASAGVTHTMGGITYRTFTVPMPRVTSATMAALHRMGVKVVSSSKEDQNRVVKASATDRDIEIQLEPLTSNTTRMRVVARNGLLFDSATATEIILQTEKILGNNA